jgi:hypothetical protein
VRRTIMSAPLSKELREKHNVSLLGIPRAKSRGCSSSSGDSFPDCSIIPVMNSILSGRTNSFLQLSGPVNPHPQRRRGHHHAGQEQRPYRQGHLGLPSQIRHPHRARITREGQRPAGPDRRPPIQSQHHQVEARQGSREHPRPYQQGPGA